MKAMILAAGKGERMRPLTDRIPKALAPLGDQRLIEPLLCALSRAGIQDVVINVCHFGEQIIAYLEEGRRYGLRIRYSDERETGALETGGGVYRALPLLGERPFLSLSADIVTDFPFASLIQKSLEGLAHLVFVKNPDFHPTGDFHLSPQGHVTFDGDNRLTFANIAVLHPQLFARCSPGKFPLIQVFRDAIAQGAVTGEQYRGKWHNVGTLQQLQAAAIVD